MPETQPYFQQTENESESKKRKEVSGLDRFGGGILGFIAGPIIVTVEAFTFAAGVIAEMLPPKPGEGIGRKIGRGILAGAAGLFAGAFALLSSIVGVTSIRGAYVGSRSHIGASGLPKYVLDDIRSLPSLFNPASPLPAAIQTASVKVAPPQPTPDTPQHTSSDAESAARLAKAESLDAQKAAQEIIATVKASNIYTPTNKFHETRTKEQHPEYMENEHFLPKVETELRKMRSNPSVEAAIEIVTKIIKQQKAAAAAAPVASAPVVAATPKPAVTPQLPTDAGAPAPVINITTGPHH